MINRSEEYGVGLLKYLLELGTSAARPETFLSIPFAVTNPVLCHRKIIYSDCDRTQCTLEYVGTFNNTLGFTLRTDIFGVKEPCRCLYKTLFTYNLSSINHSKL